MPNEKMNYGIKSFQYPPGNRPSDSAAVRTKKPKFDPDQDYIDRAKAEFKKRGGKIVKVERALWDAWKN